MGKKRPKRSKLLERQAWGVINSSFYETLDEQGLSHWLPMICRISTPGQSTSFVWKKAIGSRCFIRILYVNDIFCVGHNRCILIILNMINNRFTPSNSNRILFVESLSFLMKKEKSTSRANNEHLSIFHGFHLAINPNGALLIMEVSNPIWEQTLLLLNKAHSLNSSRKILSSQALPEGMFNYVTIRQINLLDPVLSHEKKRGSRR